MIKQAFQFFVEQDFFFSLTNRSDLFLIPFSALVGNLVMKTKFSASLNLTSALPCNVDGTSRLCLGGVTKKGILGEG